MKPAKVLGACLSLVILLGACGPHYDHTDITGVQASELGGGIDKAELSIPEGLIVKAHIEPKNDDGKDMTLSLRAIDPSVVDVSAVISANDYAFIGLKAGHTQIGLSRSFLSLATRGCRLAAGRARVAAR
jgi:hypothetical protein